MRTLRRRSRLLDCLVWCAAAASSFAVAPAAADTQAINATTIGTYPPLTTTGFNYFQPPGNYTFSFNFTANAPILVTQLGYYNSALAGTPEPSGFGSHTVTLFDVTTGKTLAVATVTATNPATGLFNYAGVTSTKLNTTDTYRVSGTMTNQFYAVGVNSSAAPVSSQINYVYTPQNIFGSLGPAGTLSDFGPNFQFAFTPALTPAQAQSSLSSLAQSKETQTVTNRILGSILLGATQQINCSSCGSAFASFGSFAIGADGRFALSDRLSLLGGVSYDNYSGNGFSVANAPIFATALRYDLVDWGPYRPFFEGGVVASPYQNVTYTRSYSSALGAGAGVGSSIDRAAAAYGRIGYVWRLSPIDEAAAYTDVTRNWQSSTGYTEATAANPFGATVGAGVDTMNIWQIGAQYTHLFMGRIETDVSAGYARAFAAKYGAEATISGFGAASGAAPSTFDWVELGGRVSYRVSQHAVLDAFVLGTLGAEPAGRQVHGGVAARFTF